jgi:hypothetical protein
LLILVASVDGVGIRNADVERGAARGEGNRAGLPMAVSALCAHRHLAFLGSRHQLTWML